MDEWRYTSGVVYFSVYGLEVHSELEGKKLNREKENGGNLLSCFFIFYNTDVIIVTIFLLISFFHVFT
jgi:hypothetical protein